MTGTIDTENEVEVVKEKGNSDIEDENDPLEEEVSVLKEEEVERIGDDGVGLEHRYGMIEIVRDVCRLEEEKVDPDDHRGRELHLHGDEGRLLL